MVSKLRLILTTQNGVQRLPSSVLIRRWTLEFRFEFRPLALKPNRLLLLSDAEI